jgi:hypothetical protein
VFNATNAQQDRIYSQLLEKMATHTSVLPAKFEVEEK